MTTRLVKTPPRQTYNSAVKACRALVEHERLSQRANAHFDRDELKRVLHLAESKYTEALAHAKKVIAACEGK